MSWAMCVRRIREAAALALCIFSRPKGYKRKALPRFETYHTVLLDLDVENVEGAWLCRSTSQGQF